MFWFGSRRPNLDGNIDDHEYNDDYEYDDDEQDATHDDVEDEAYEETNAIVNERDQMLQITESVVPSDGVNQPISLPNEHPKETETDTIVRLKGSIRHSEDSVDQLKESETHPDQPPLDTIAFETLSPDEFIHDQTTDSPAERPDTADFPKNPMPAVVLMSSISDNVLNEESTSPDEEVVQKPAGSHTPMEDSGEASDQMIFIEVSEVIDSKVPHASIGICSDLDLRLTTNKNDARSSDSSSSAMNGAPRIDANSGSENGGHQNTLPYGLLSKEDYGGNQESWLDDAINDETETNQKLSILDTISEIQSRTTTPMHVELAGISEGLTLKPYEEETENGPEISILDSINQIQWRKMTPTQIELSGIGEGFIPTPDDTRGENGRETSILDSINQMQSRKTTPMTLELSGIGEGVAPETDDGQVEKGREILENDYFLVNDELLAKTLSIYEQISSEDELLLESFRAVEKTAADKENDAETLSPNDTEPASVAHLKKLRIQAPREISQESQSLFDMLDKDFASVTPRVTLNIAGMSRHLSSDDVKLCFAAFVSCFSPPRKSHFATEYNYTNNDFGETRGNSGAADDSSVGSNNSGVKSVTSAFDDKADPERFPRPRVPNSIVMALWTDVIRSRFLDRSDITQSLAMKIEAVRGDAFAPALGFIRDTLVLLGVLDVRKMTDGSQRNNDEDVLSMEETYFVETSRGAAQHVEEVISVHQDIHQQYGEYLTKESSKDNYYSIVEKHHKRWNCVVVDSCPRDFRREPAVSFMVQLLPWNTIRANRFREAASLLSDKKFLNRRLQSLGVLEGTTAQVTDAEELVLLHFEKRNTILCFEAIDPDQTMLDAYDRTRKDISRQVEELEHVEEDGVMDLLHSRRLKMLRIETGKAMHLMGVSLGAQGFTEQELEYCRQALELKRAVAFGPTVTVADTLHCVGFSLDSAGAYLEAMEFYNQSLVIRRNLLGNEDVRVAETLHNKGAILCENGECDDAMACLEEALHIRSDQYGEHHESCADTQQWIGNVHREIGQYDEALQYFQTALATKKVILGPDHEEVANTLQNMAVVLDDLGKYKLSLECYNEALRIYSLQFGREHLRVADTLQRIAMDFSILEEPEQALKHFMEAIGLREKLLEEEKCRLSDSDFILRSLIHSDGDDLDEALVNFGDMIECYDEALELTTRLHSNDHEALSHILHRSADLYFEIQEYDKAIERLEAALKSERVIAQEHHVNEPNVCCMLHKMGVVHLYKGEYQHARRCFESVVYRKRKLLTPDRGGEASALYCLGVAFDSLGTHKLSLSAFTEALNVWKEESGEHDVRCGYSLFWLGTEEFNAERYTEAIVWCRGALRTFKDKKADIDYAVVAKTLNLLGQTHEMMEDKESALRCYSEGIRLVRWKLGENHDFIIDMLCKSGNIQQSLGFTDDAIVHYEDAMTVMKNSDHEDLQLCSTIQTLALLFKRNQDYDRAKELLSESYRMYESILGQDDLRSAGVILELGQVLDLHDSHEAAMQCFREALRVQQRQLSPEHADVAETLYRMGVNLALSSRHEDSIQCLQQALSIQRNAHGDNHHLVARTLHNLAASYKATGSFDKAIVCYKEALRILTNMVDVNVSKVAEISFEMAESHEANDNYHAAALKYRDALAFWRDSDDESSWLPIVLHKLGLVRLKAGGNDDAVENLSEALDIIEDEGDEGCNKGLLPPTIAGLARAYSNVGSFDSAIAFYQRHVDLLKSDSTANDGVSDSLFAMGTIYARVNNLDDAISHFKECLLVRRNKFGGTDERVARVLVNMGVVFERQEDFVAAKDCFTEASRVFKGNGNERDASSSLQDLGRTLVKQGALDSALECYSESLQISKKLVGSNDPQAASLHYICGTTLYDMGQYDKALTSFRQSVQIRTKVSPASKETAEAICMVGQTLVRLEEYDEAITSLSEALESLLLIKGPESLDVGNCHHSLGLAFSAKGDHKHAIGHFLNAVLPRQLYFGEDSIELSETQFELAEGYSQLGEWDSAAEFAVSALRIRKIVIGTETFEYGESVSQLGDIQRALSKPSEALNCYREALKVFSVVEGRGHVTVAQCLEKIGLLYVEQNQLADASESLKRAMKIYTETLGGLSSQVASVLLALGKAEVSKSSLENAVAYFKESLRISRELNQDAAVATALYEIGVVLESKGKGIEAFECYKETLRLSENSESTLTKAKTMNRIGGLLADQGKVEGAMKACEKALTLFNEAKGPTAVDICDAYQIMAGIHESNREFEVSLDLLQKAHKMLVDRLGQTDLSVARVLNNLAINHARRRDFQKAFELCSEALEIRRAKLGTSHLDTCDTLYNVANIVDEWGKIDEAMKYYIEALEGYHRILGHEDMEVANCFQYIGTLHLKKEEFEQAMQAFVESLRIHQLFGDESDNTATILLNLGTLYNRKQDHDRALEVLAHCLRIQKATISDENQVANTYDQIGVAYAGKGQRIEAKTVFEKALKMLTGTGKSDAIEAAHILDHLAGVLSDEDTFDEALKHYHTALQIFKRDIGEVSDAVAATLMQIGLIHNKRVDYEEALRHLTSSMRIRSTLFGRDDMKVAETLFEVGKVMEEWGDSDEALDSYGEVIRIVKIHFGQLHVLVAEAMKRMGSIHVEKGDHDEALICLNQAMALQRRVLSESAVEIGHTLLSIGAVHDARSEEDHALAAYSEALKLFRMNLGDEDVLVALALNNIGINHARRKNYSKAISMCRETLRMRRLKLGGEHLDVADSCLNIANILDEWGKDDEALSHYKEALQLYKNHLGDDDPEVANCLYAVGVIYMKQNDHQRAVTCLMEAIRIFRLKRGATDLNVAQALYNLGRVYGQTAEYDKALACFNESLRIRQEKLGESHADVIAVHRYIEAVERKRRR